ncbi:MAG: DUF5723 family protein [Bacteroidales bacterium]|nr:DUF5723 family protein [Bacteroidales bacterium]MDD3859116.1 DUF5723 family protein [Bacteroidales bacterium]
MKKYILVLIFAGVFGVTYGQQALTLYNMDRVMQSQFVNPSIDVPYKIHIGGLLIPIVGQIPPPLYFNYANNSFYWNHIYHKKPNTVADTAFMVDIPLFMNKLHNTNHLRFDTQIELFNIGIRLENMFITVALTERFKYGVSLPYDLFEFTLNGNMPYMLESKPHDFSGLGVNFTHFREFAVGGSMKANDDITVGARMKILFGLANVTTDFKEFSLYTDPEDYSLTAITDMKIHASLPVYFDYIVHSTDGHLDSLDFEINETSVEEFLGAEGDEDYLSAATKYLMNFKNIGLGFDFGATYKFNPEIEFFASVTDFGFISWNTNPQNFISKGEYDFRGIEIEVWENEDDMNESMDKLVDTLVNTFIFDLVETGYVTWLPSSIYVGGKYKFHELLHFTALYRGEFYRKNYMQSLTLGINSNLTNFLSAHLTWSLANNYAGNVGFGLSARMGFMSWYLITDSFTNMIWPQKAKNVNIRIGCNMVFGYKKIKSNASMRT